METNKQSLETARAQIGNIKYQTSITSGNHTIIADEPESVQGGDTGMTPYSLMLCSLGSCTAITLRMYTDRKMWPVDTITIELELIKNDNGLTIKKRLSFAGNVTEEQKARLLQIADACPLHKILVKSINIEGSIV